MTYAALLSLGLAGGVGLALLSSRRFSIPSAYAFDAALLSAIGGLAGARAAYVALNWAYYRHHLVEGLRFWAGGLAWLGGLPGALLLVALYAAICRPSLRSLLDALALPLAWFTLCIWLGSGAANDIYGRETFPTDGLWWQLSADLPDLYGLRAPRINVVLMGVLWSGIVLLALTWLSRRPTRPGALFWLYLALTGLGGLALVPLQANPAPYLLRVRLDGWAYLALVAAGLTGLVAPRLWR